jgi:hypothetical protein
MANPMRVLVLLVLGALLATGVASAQAPPSPPHTFFGQSPTLDGSAVADGTVVSAIDESGVVVGTGTVEAGNWLIQVDPDTDSVTITIGDAAAEGPFAVESGALTEVTLNLTSGTPTTDPPPTTPPPGTLPNGGTGGLGDIDGGFPMLPILAALAIAMMAGLGVREWSTRR